MLKMVDLTVCGTFKLNLKFELLNIYSLQVDQIARPSPLSWFLPWTCLLM